MTQKIPRPISGGLILSYTCSAECRHCVYACSPRWSADWISEEDIRRVLGQLAPCIQAAPSGPRTIGLNAGLHFTGGEPFLNYELLCKAVEIAREYAIPSTFVETNCSWCADNRITKEKLRILKEKGLQGIMISVNPFFLEYVPFERTERAIRIGLEVFGENVAVYQEEYYRRFKELGITASLPFEDYLKLEGREDFIRHAEFLVMGRAPYKLKDILKEVLPRYPAATFGGEPCRPPLLRNWHNHFDNYGNYMPGYCGGISLGDCRELDTLLQNGLVLEGYPVLRFLLNDDFEGLLRFAGDFGYRVDREGYFSKCHLCTDVRKHLAAEGEFKELQPKEFYFHLE